MKLLHSTLAVFFALLLSCNTENKEDQIVYISDQLEIYAIAPQAYVHKSYLQTDDYGKVGCNGLIYVDKDQSIIFDTPADTTATRELIEFLEQQLKTKISAIIPTHSHGDCLAGLSVAHDMGIPSFGETLTVELAKEAGETEPMVRFDGEITIPVGDSEVWIGGVGEGHTRDNVIAYMPTIDVMFGGCLVKSLGASEGYTGEANLSEWSNTIEKIKKKFPKTKLVVPGHGKWGDQELLEYTAILFRQ
ncbi:MAG: subclass B1 metallo-beta-lactamase [Reichenbachiella sp.]|uniref:subclass B1 metallo-beta-lactamase n=1 Tax=Reichenbachiella sp. TaxID=2184521 RepID=UPI003264827B